MTESEEPRLSSTPPGPGNMLVRARTELGMSVEDVASELRLSPRQISALEQDDYQALPGPTYVRGYLRNYARLVGLSETEVIQESQPTPVEGSESPCEVSPQAQHEVKSSDRHVKLFSYLLAGVLMGMLIVWWQGREESKLATLDGGVEVPLEVPGVGVGAGVGTKPQLSELEVSPVVVSNAPVADATITPVTPSPEVLSPQEVGGEAGEDTVPTLVSPASVDSATVLQPGYARLRLDFTQACWTDIRDAQQKRLVYDTIPAGKSLIVDGKPPLQLFFGNAAGVKLHYNGKPVDLTPYVRREFARLELGNSQADP
ncbi:MAG: helix-turn-helix domain-containing protein [Gammaproteobacteria bacterium]|nr:helix-turn-helix domain-containing protein [Gammaproteobacteria bacterium]